MTEGNTADLEKIRNAATKALEKLGSRYTREVPRPSADAQLFLERCRILFQEGTHATNWDDKELKSYAAQVELLRTGFVAGFEYGSPAESVLDTSCAFSCKAERDACLAADCPGETSFPCTCCVDCNLAELVCYADCIVSR